MIGLADFDQAIIEEYSITERKLELVSRYVRLLQGDEAPTLRDIAVGGYYGSSALLHEVVELDILLERDPRLLRRSPAEVQRLFRANEDTHCRALSVEYGYLQRIIRELFGEEVSIGALIMANASSRDFYVLVSSHEPLRLFKPDEPDENEVVRAALLLQRLRARGKEMLQ